MGGKLAKKIFAKSGGKQAGKILLLGTKPADYAESSLKAIRQLSGISCIYISMGRLWRETNDELEKNGVDTSKFYWIGGTGVGFWSKDSTLKGKTAENVTLMEGPKAIFHLSMAIDLLVGTGKYSCMYFDNLNVLFDNNPPQSVLKFVTLTAKKLKAKGVSAIFVCVEDGKTEKLLPKTAECCDSRLVAKDL